MATVSVTFGRPAIIEGHATAIMSTTGARTETVASGAASTNSAIKGDVVRVAVTGGNVYMKVGTAPTATTSDILLLDGTVEYFQLQAGQKVAVLNA